MKPLFNRSLETCLGYAPEELDEPFRHVWAYYTKHFPKEAGTADASYGDAFSGMVAEDVIPDPDAPSYDPEIPPQLPPPKKPSDDAADASGVAEAETGAGAGVGSRA